MNQKDFTESELSSKLLFSRIVLGDKIAFTEAYNQYNKLLYTVAFKYFMNEEMAQDTVQHVFAKLWESRSTIVVSTSLKNYLFTMTKNHILNVIRNQNTALQKNYEIAQTSEIIEDNLIKRIEQSEMYEHFYAAIENLPTNKREICLLKIREELSNQEIADKMQLSVNTVKTHYSESIKLLKKSLSHLIFLIVLITFLSKLCVYSI